MRTESSQLKTVSLSRIVRENLLNYDDATIYHNEKNLIFLSTFGELIFIVLQQFV